jgi:hypothetical protein
MATPTQLIQKINKLVEDSASSFNGKVPALQQRVLDEIFVLLKDLDTRGDTISATVKNIRMIGDINRKLQRIIFDEGYKKAVEDYLKAYNDIATFQNQYFSAIIGAFKPTKVLQAIQEQSIQFTLDGLTEAGLTANVIDPIKGILQKSITTGGSYKGLTEALRVNLTNTDEGEGVMSRYLKTYTITSVSQYSRNYSQTVAEGLNFRWYRYVGSNTETTRCFCLAMTEKHYFHKSEIPDILAGRFPEFKDQGCSLNSKTGLPEGMIKGTNSSNFMTYAGGWNCQHSIFPVPDSAVPQELRDRFSDAA